VVRRWHERVTWVVQQVLHHVAEVHARPDVRQDARMLAADRGELEASRAEGLAPVDPCDVIQTMPGSMTSAWPSRSIRTQECSHLVTRMPARSDQHRQDVLWEPLTSKVCCHGRP
jgi:hypothetical protein